MSGGALISHTNIGIASVLSIALAPSAHAADIVVDTNVACLDAEVVCARILAVLQQHASEPGRVTLRARVLQNTIDVALHVVTTTDTEAFERRFTLAHADCANVPELAVAVLDALLKTLPQAHWTTPRQPLTPVVAAEAPSLPQPRHPSGKLRLDISTIAWGRHPSRVPEIELGVLVRSEHPRWSGHGPMFGVGGRLAAPQRLGVGRYFDSSVLASLGWEANNERHRLRVLFGAGVVVTRGTGYVRNMGALLPWYELRGGWSRRIGGFAVGFEAAVSPLRHHVATVVGDTAALPWLRLGLHITSRAAIL